MSFGWVPTFAQQKFIFQMTFQLIPQDQMLMATLQPTTPYLYIMNSDQSTAFPFFVTAGILLFMLGVLVCWGHSRWLHHLYITIKRRIEWTWVWIKLGKEGHTERKQFQDYVAATSIPLTRVPCLLTIPSPIYIPQHVHYDHYHGTTPILTVSPPTPP
jgi:hypothetical protein